MRLVWKRRHWTREPDSEKRERRYQLRDRSEWIEMAVPDLRIVDDSYFEAVQAEMNARKRTTTSLPLAQGNRNRHLIFGLIRCSCCGSNCTISGKDY